MSEINAGMVQYMYNHVIPAAFSLLPDHMNQVEAKAMLLAIGMQESRFTCRVQLPNGPAHGFWQFETGGVQAVIHSNQTILNPILSTLNYPMITPILYEAISHNDILAAIFARLLLWSVPISLPSREESAKGWNEYTFAWRPGKPHPETWNPFFAQAWGIVGN
jgi:hypothetical protein